MKNNNLYHYLILIVITFIAWFGFLEISPLSEDFLALSFHLNATFQNSFEVFITNNVDGVYWRPIEYFSYRIVEAISPGNILIHRSVNLLLYTNIILLFFTFLKKLRFSQSNSFVISLFFSLIYAHEYQLAWIPGRTDLFMTFFVLLTSINLIDFSINRNYRNIIFALINFSLALLSKEHALITIFLPVVMLSIISQIRIIDSIKISFLFALQSIFIFTYRFFIIGGSPFESQNFESLNLIQIIINFIAYIPLSFIRPEELEVISQNIILILLVFIIAIGLFVLLFINRKKGNFVSGLFLFGASWFIFFLLPALPTLMRWYVFLPSIGLFILLAYVLEVLKYSYIKILIIFLIILNFIAIQFRQNDWQNAAKISQEILNNIPQIDTKDSLIIWGLPDKYERVNVFKIAPNVQFENKMNTDRNKIYSPLRSEFYDESKFKIEYGKSSVIMTIENGRFFPRTAKSTFVFKHEDYIFDFCDYNIKINSYFSDNIFISKAIISKTDNKSNFTNYFFNGKILINETHFK